MPCFALLLTGLLLAPQDAPARSSARLPLADQADAWARALLDRGLEERGAWTMLQDLVQAAPKRLSGSRGYEDAVAWAEEAMRSAGLEGVRREAVMVPRWERGSLEEVIVREPGGAARELAACTLGGSGATPAEGVEGQVILVNGLSELEEIGAAARGRIVFFNQPMDPTARTTFSAYGTAVGQRTRGPAAAARLGAVATLVRSMSTADDDVPHTGATRFPEDVAAIPALALGIRSADWLAERCAGGEPVTVSVRADCRTLPDVEQWSVIGELRGAELPEEYLVVGGHLDAWDKGVGAHDDGGGCAQSIEAARLLLACGIQPRRTIRVVLFANEENGLRGGTEYARRHGEARHHFALESDSGVFAPRGIALNLSEEAVERLRPLGAPLDAVGAGSVFRGGGGADIRPLASLGVPVGSLRVTDARYFDLHHSENDRLDAVNPRELELGAVVLAYWLVVLAETDAALLG